MIHRTEEEIVSLVNEIWFSDTPYSSSEGKSITVEILEDETKVTITRMYEAPGLNLEKLMRMAEFFGTKNIDDADRIDNPGCESCDYGSCRGFTLVIRPEEKK